MGIIHNLLERGISIPGQVAVIGFDNTILSKYYYPPVTTIHTPRLELGLKSIEMLLNNIFLKIQNKPIPIEGVTLMPELVIRKTT